MHKVDDVLLSPPVVRDLLDAVTQPEGSLRASEILHAPLIN